MNDVLQAFRTHVDSIRKLMSFDRDVLDLALTGLRKQRDRMKSAGFDNPALSSANTIQMLENIRANESLKPRFELVINQALVLLVSYFASVMDDLFKQSVAKTLANQVASPVHDLEIKLTIGELHEAGASLSDRIPEWLVLKRDISFQDMQSISRAFKDALGIVIGKTAEVNDIILGQAARHVIVHAGGIADERFFNQTRGATPRNVRTSVTVGERLQFSSDEVELIATSMEKYIARVLRMVESPPPPASPL